MKLDKLFWSKTKVDILKYLVFKRQWVSMRALENELPWSFPAIKKQTDILLDAGIIKVDKVNNKWSIYINAKASGFMKDLFIQWLQFSLINLLNQYDTIIDKYYLGKIFWNDVEADMVIIYKRLWWDFIDKIKEDIWRLFGDYYIDTWRVVFLSVEDFDRRYRLADNFVLSVIRNCK